MKVLAISDVIVETLYSPALREVARDVELVISCGDLPSAYLEYIVSLLDVPLYYVMGNHGARGGSREFPEGCINLDGRVVNQNGLLLAGLEGSLRYNDAPRYQYTENEMRAKIAYLSRYLWLNRMRYGRFLDVLVTHAPPFGIQDASDPAHHGFKSLLGFIDRFHPDYLIHGHTHLYDNRAVRQSVRGHTLIINAYGYLLLDIPKPGGNGKQEERNQDLEKQHDTF
ncbi:MAG TPA: metallophosphoesterase [Anaerolineae bacterium]|nr:metallophosphoesterase [Anaerolineae bacterium]